MVTAKSYENFSLSQYLEFSKFYNEFYNFILKFCFDVLCFDRRRPFLK